MMSTKPAYLVILGCGQVGRSLLELVGASLKFAKHSGVRVLAVFDSKHGIVGDHLDGPALQTIIESKLANKRLGDVQGIGGSCVTQEASEAWETVMKLSAQRDVVVADCSASEETTPMLVQALDLSMGVVLANKKPISGPMEVFRTFVGHGPLFRHESTVGAGSPFITSFGRIVAAGDRVEKVAGVFSGTLAYVMTGLEDGKKVSDVVVEAKSLGFTEPDPRDDLGGVDVARKALILARMMGWELEMKDVRLESMVPEECSAAAMPLDDFMSRGLQQMDAPMRQKVQDASAKGEVLRYAATIENGACNVGLVSVSKDTPLGRLRGTDNMLCVSTGCYTPSPLVIQGAGAGPMCTALGVMADAIEVFNAM